MPKLLPDLQKWVARSSGKRSGVFHLIDIGSETVKVAVVSIGPSGATLVGNGLASTGGALLEEGRASVPSLVLAVEEALTCAEESAAAELDIAGLPDDAVFAVPARLVWGNLFLVSTRRKRPEAPITSREVHAVRERAVRLAHNRLPRIDNGGRGRLEVLSINTVWLSLDGREAVAPVGLKGKEIVCAVYGMAGLAAGLRALHILSRGLELRLRGVIPTQLSTAACVPGNEVLLCDVGASGTYITQVRERSVVASGQFRLGGRFFSQELAGAFEISLDDAEVLKRAYALGALGAEDEKAVRERLVLPLSRWGRECAETLRTFGGDSELPGCVYLTGGGALLPGLGEALKAMAHRAGLPFRRLPDVSMFAAEGLPGVRNYPPGSGGSYSPLL